MTTRRSQNQDTLPEILRDPKKRRTWVIYQLGLKGMNLSDIARTQGVTRGAVYRCFKVPYPKMEAAVANALGMHIPDLWPERYTNGVPNRRRGRPEKSVTKSQHSAGNSGRKARV